MTAIFFYGLFMDRALLERQGLRPKVLGTARLDGYRLHIGERATLLPSAGSRAFGVAIELTGDEARALYSDPSVRAYRAERVKVTLVSSGETVEAECYNLPPESAPVGANPEYATELARLAETLGFDASYVAEIAAMR